MGAYWIEPSPTAQSSCKQCGKRLAKGEMRFGHNRMGGGYYHLTCAAAGRPQAAKRYAKELAAAIKDLPTSASPAPVVDAGIPRNRELEKALRESAPDDKQLLQVYADWLLSQGHPWGKLIMLAQSGDDKGAAKLFTQHSAELTSGLAAGMFEWEGGFIKSVVLKARKTPQAITLFDAILAIPAAVMVRELTVPFVLDDAFADHLSAHAPASLRRLIIVASQSLNRLVLPSLESLQIQIRLEPAEPSGPLFGRGSLPRLQTLEFFGGQNQLPQSFVESLFASEVLPRLQRLKFSLVNFTADTTEFLVENKAKLAHLQQLDFKPLRPELAEAFGRTRS